MNEYPLVECRDCFNRDNCDLISKINSFLDDNSFLDISSSSCEEYTTSHTVDNGWMAYTGNGSPEHTREEEIDFDMDLDLPSVEEMFEVLEEALDSLVGRDFVPIGVDMSYDTMQLFLEESVQGSHIKFLESKSHGKIKVTENKEIDLGFFAIAVRLEIADGHGDGENEDSDT